ncbi:MAG: hypothetical protein M3076_08215 [Actinomycetota bacterium]|nr:hypothetical protein [Actinomycetota bacterium]
MHVEADAAGAEVVDDVVPQAARSTAQTNVPAETESFARMRRKGTAIAGD